MKYYLYECNLNPDFDWKSWRIFILSLAEKKAKMVPFNLDGAADLANPHITILKTEGSLFRSAVITLFVPSEAITPLVKARPG